METLQELEVWYIIPSIRKELALALKSSDLNQVEIGKKLGVTKSAVNQYFHKRRANELKFSNEFVNEIKNSASRISNHFDTHREIQHLLLLSRKEKLVCQVHKLRDKQFVGCNVCFEKPELLKVKS